MYTLKLYCKRDQLINLPMHNRFGQPQHNILYGGVTLLKEYFNAAITQFMLGECDRNAVKQFTI